MENSNETPSLDQDLAIPDKRGWLITAPFRAYTAYRTKKRLERERVLLLREERMNEDLERYLMEIEERRCWLAFQLSHLNFERMKKRHVVHKFEKQERERERVELEEQSKENGLSYSQGSIIGNRRWQNTAAKHLDFLGHAAPVTACRLSPCLGYLISSSEDKSLRIWNIYNGECLKVMLGHEKVVNDCDVHPQFKMYSRTLSIISCSGDNTIRIWNSSDTKPMKTIFGHENAIYKSIFAPDGNSFVTCSEDRTIRTWCFPEGYNLFVYNGHVAPVISTRFSGSGRYIVSGSDYGERKIIMWDAKMPLQRDPQLFPHILRWSPEGLIRKIFIRKTVPKPNFWLAQHQLHWINDSELDIWPGELDDDEEEYQAEEDDDDDENDANDGGEDDDGLDNIMTLNDKQKKLEQNSIAYITAHDTRDKKGISLRVMAIAPNGDQQEAVEYHPNGHIIIRVQVSQSL